MGLREARARVLADHEVGGAAFGAALSALVDHALGAAFGTPGDGYALVAAGSYGRRELCPASDVDVVLLHPRAARDVAALADALWYPLWDAGFDLGHGVRTVRDAVRAADADLETLTAFVDVRHVAGDPAVSAALVHRVRDLAVKRRGRLVAQLADSARARRARPGPVAELLEPDLKAGAGGLRDVHALAWAGWALGAPGGLDALVAGGYLDAEDREVLAVARGVLLDARVANHRASGGRRDVLRLQDQDEVARLVGAPDADVLARGVSAAARKVAWITGDVWSRLLATESGPPARSGSDRVVAPGVVVRDGRVTVTDLDAVSGDVVLRAAAAAARLDLPFDRPTLRAFAGAGSPSWDAAARADFLSVLGSGRRAVAVFEALDHVGVLTTLVPEWEAVRSLPQRNAYHRFTVDRHLLEAVAECQALLADRGGPGFDPTLARDAARDAGSTAVLLLAALLHDIGKGGLDDHSEVGAGVARAVGERIGVEDVETLVWLVRHHLLLADTASRRDLSDPVTVERFAAAVGDPGRLRLLYLLTVGDSRATGPAAWGPTKAALVRDLTARTLAALAGSPVTEEFAPALLDEHRDLLDAGVVAVRWDVGPEPSSLGCTVVAPDRPGLLALVTGALALSGFDVRDAAVVGAGGMALERFTGADRFGRLADPEGRSRAGALVEAAVTGAESIDARLRDYDARYAGRGEGPRAWRTSVDVDLEASAASTVLEVHAIDAPGLLARLAGVLADRGLDVVAAKVQTLGEQVVDVFYVRETDGAKPVDPARLAALREALEAASRPVEGGA